MMFSRIASLRPRAAAPSWRRWSPMPRDVDVPSTTHHVHRRHIVALGHPSRALSVVANPFDIYRGATASEAIRRDKICNSRRFLGTASEDDVVIPPLDLSSPSLSTPLPPYASPSAQTPKMATSTKKSPAGSSLSAGIGKMKGQTHGQLTTGQRGKARGKLTGKLGTEPTAEEGAAQPPQRTLAPAVGDHKVWLEEAKRRMDARMGGEIPSLTPKGPPPLRGHRLEAMAKLNQKVAEIEEEILAGLTRLDNKMMNAHVLRECGLTPRQFDNVRRKKQKRGVQAVLLGRQKQYYAEHGIAIPEVTSSVLESELSLEPATTSSTGAISLNAIDPKERLEEAKTKISAKLNRMYPRLLDEGPPPLSGRHLETMIKLEKALAKVEEDFVCGGGSEKLLGPLYNETKYAHILREYGLTPRQFKKVWDKHKAAQRQAVLLRRQREFYAKHGAAFSGDPISAGRKERLEEAKRSIDAKIKAMLPSLTADGLPPLSGLRFEAMTKLEGEIAAIEEEFLKSSSNNEGRKVIKRLNMKMRDARVLREYGLTPRKYMDIQRKYRLKVQRRAVLRGIQKQYYSAHGIAIPEVTDCGSESVTLTAADKKKKLEEVEQRLDAKLRGRYPSLTAEGPPALTGRRLEAMARLQDKIAKIEEAFLAGNGDDSERLLERLDGEMRLYRLMKEAHILREYGLTPGQYRNARRGKHKAGVQRQAFMLGRQREFYAEHGIATPDVVNSGLESEGPAINFGCAVTPPH